MLKLIVSNISFLVHLIGVSLLSIDIYILNNSILFADSKPYKHRIFFTLPPLDLSSMDVSDNGNDMYQPFGKLV